MMKPPSTRQEIRPTLEEACMHAMRELDLTADWPPPEMGGSKKKLLA